MPRLRTTPQTAPSQQGRKQAIVPEPSTATVEAETQAAPKAGEPAKTALEERLPELKLAPVTIFLAALTEQGQVLKAKTSPYLLPSLDRMQALVDEVQKLTPMRVVGLGIGRTLHLPSGKGWMAADQAIAAQISPANLPVLKGRIGYRGFSVTAGVLTMKIAIPGCSADANIERLARALAAAAGLSGDLDLEVRENTNQSYSVGTDDPIPSTANKYRMWATSAAKRGRDADVEKNLEAYETWIELRRQVVLTGIWGEMGRGRRISGPAFTVRSTAPVAEVAPGPAPVQSVVAAAPKAESVPVPKAGAEPKAEPKAEPTQAPKAEPKAKPAPDPSLLLARTLQTMQAQSAQTLQAMQAQSAQTVQALKAQAEAVTVLAERMRLNRRYDRHSINVLVKALQPQPKKK